MDVNFLAVFFAAVSSMVIGTIWYGPLFGKQWMKLVGLTQKDMDDAKKTMPITYGQMFLDSLMTSFVLAMVIGMADEKSVANGILIAFILWLGFNVTVRHGDVLFNKKPWKLFFIEIGYYFVFFVAAGFIIASF